MDGLAAAFDELNDEELVPILGFPIGPRGHHILLWELWKRRPHTAERLLTATLRTTQDLELAKGMATDVFGYDLFIVSFWFNTSGAREGWVRALTAGLANPSSQVRSLCEERLAEFRERSHGR